jgi:hypothetical protein
MKENIYRELTRWNCRYCLAGLTSRCESSQLLGCPALPGAQAQYIRIPKAGGTLVPISSSNAEKDIPPRSAILLADILPTGYFAAIQAFHHPNLSAILHRRKTLEKGDTGYVDSLYSKEIDGLCKQDEPRTVVFAVVGLGPVGLVSLCSIRLIVVSITGIRICVHLLYGSITPRPVSFMSHYFGWRTEPLLSLLVCFDLVAGPYTLRFVQWYKQ